MELNMTPEEERAANERIRKNRRSVVGTTTELATGAVTGTLAGLAVPGASIPVLTAAAHMVGWTLVGASPVGWVVAAAAAGTLGGLAAARLVRHAGGWEKRREEMSR